jgi:hypothetical protein
MFVLRRINECLPLKPTSVGDPDVYLGAKLRNVRLENGVYAWALSPSKYVSQAVANGVAHLDKNFDGKYKLPVKAENPFSTIYDLTSDTSDVLDPEQASFFMHLILLEVLLKPGRAYSFGGTPKARQPLLLCLLLSVGCHVHTSGT